MWPLRAQGSGWPAEALRPPRNACRPFEPGRTARAALAAIPALFQREADRISIVSTFDQPLRVEDHMIIEAPASYDRCAERLEATWLAFLGNRTERVRQ